MFFARQAKHVVTYEANPANVMRIKENLCLNNIQMSACAAWRLETGLGSLELTVNQGGLAWRPAIRTLPGNFPIGGRSFNVPGLRLDG